MSGFFALLLAVVVFCTPTGYATAQANKKSEIRRSQEETRPSVSWYQSTIVPGKTPNRVIVVVSGTTSPGAQITVATDAVIFIDSKGKIRTLSTKKVFPEGRVEADERGFFDLHLYAPLMLMQLPVEVKLPNGETKNYQLTLEINAESVKLAGGQKDVKISPYARRNWGVWGGVGASYLHYELKTTVPSNIDFQSFSGPSFYAKLAKLVKKDYLFQLTGNHSPGKTKGSDSLTLTQDQYNWTFITSDVTYFKPAWKRSVGKHVVEFGAQAGLQYHMIPFVVRSSASNENVMSVETDNVLMLSGGVTGLFHYGRYWLFETFMRYQHPVMDGSLFAIQPNFTFDGSVGVVYKLRPDWRVGGFWYGQWHDYDVSDHNDKYFAANGGDNPVSGEQSLFFSNLEFRVGWEFD